MKLTGDEKYLQTAKVTPCVGVWIETLGLKTYLSNCGMVTPCVGVWIETSLIFSV